MFRKRLISNGACLRCRQRRIKCDEAHPVCARCARWDFECVWRTEQKPNSKRTESDCVKTLLVKAHNGRALPLQCYQDGYLATGFESFQDENQKQLVESAIQFVRRYTSLGITSGRGDLSFVTTLILQSSWSRLALSAFTASAMSRWQRNFETVALKSHQAALVELRFNISSGRAHETDVRCLTSIFFLGMMEYFAHGNPKAAFNHLSIVARMAVVLHEKLSKTLQEASSRWIVAMIHMSLALCANSFWIEPRLYTVFEGEWDSLDKFVFSCVLPLADTYQVCLPEDALKARVQIQMNRMIFKGPTSSHVRIVQRFVDDLEVFLATANPVSIHTPATNTKHGWAADICGFRLYITAVAEPAACSNDRRLRLLMDEWNDHNTKFLQSLGGSMPHLEFLLPMTELSIMGQLGIGMYYIPFLCLVHDLAWFEEIAAVYNSLNIILDADVAARVQAMIETIRVRKRGMHCTLEEDGHCPGKHDGLDFLRHPQGVLC